MTTSFHNTIDSNVRALQAYNPRTGWGPILASLYTTYNFSLSYQFYPHYHPYVLQLARTLAETDSVYDLLAMNVQYQANADSSLRAIPNSTRAALATVPGGAQLLDANQKPVLTGAPLTILDSNTPLAITVPAAALFNNLDGSTGSLSAAAAVSLALPIAIPSFATSGVAVTLPAGTSVVPSRTTTASPLAAATPIILPDETLVTLTKITSAWISDGTPVTLPVNTQVLIRTGLPLPEQTPVQLYQQIFTATNYNPSAVVRAPYPVNDLDFSTTTGRSSSMPR
jgi:hypothetical protein